MSGWLRHVKLTVLVDRCFRYGRVDDYAAICTEGWIGHGWMDGRMSDGAVMVMACHGRIIQT